MAHSDIILRVPDPITISLAYSGPLADDGTMPVSDVISALEGFSGAYAKLATRLTPHVEHRLRVTDIHHSSFTVMLASLVFLGTQPTQQQLLEVTIDSVKRVVGALVKLVSAKKHTRGRPGDITIEGNENTIYIVNGDHAKFEIPHDLVDIYREGLIDGDLARMASPLRRNEIDSARISADGIAGEITAVEISESDRSSFETTSSVTVSTTNDTPIEGTFVSLNKENNSGRFRLQDGTGVPYKFIGNDPYSFHSQFSIRGAVRIICDAELDQNLRPTRLAIKSVQQLQARLF